MLKISLPEGWTVACADVYVGAPESITLCTLVSVCDLHGFTIAELA